MQCVILAAGEGTRMRPLTLERPKPLIEVAGEPIIAHIVRALPEEINELILVVSYKHEMLRAYCGETFLGKRVRYVLQENPKGGTGDALICARALLDERCMVMYGDDIHGARALKEACMHERAMLAAHSPTPEKFGVVETNPDGTLLRIIEKPEHPQSTLVNIGGFVLTKEIFSYDVAQSASGEHYLTDMVTAYAAEYPVSVIEQVVWLPIGYPEDIAKAEAALGYHT